MRTARDIAKELKAKRRKGGGWSARCPAHDDERASLSIAEGADGRALLHCFAGCTFENIARKLHIDVRDLMPDDRGAERIFPYVDEHGGLLYEVVRRPPKEFRQRRPNGNGGWSWRLNGVRRVPYRLPEVLAAVSAGRDVVVVEGEKDADALGQLGFTATTNSGGAGKWRDEHSVPLRNAMVVIIPDNDLPGYEHARAVAKSLGSVGARVRMLLLPGLRAKGDISDWLSNGHTAGELRALLADAPLAADVHWPDVERPTARPAKPAATPVALADAHGTFTRWLGPEYDLAALDATLCALAANELTGDPCWLLIISGPGAAKTETVQAARGAGAHIVSTIASEGALLSATSRQQRTKDATGGLLRVIGERGVVVIKDVTSIISMDRNTRAGVLAALRELYDGAWVRNVGTDGGRTLSWTGRLTLVGAVTTAWDRAHDVISSMGDRFVSLRLDSTTGRDAAGRRAMATTGSEGRMRDELAAAVGGVLGGIRRDADLTLSEEEQDALLAAADLVTLARTGVDFDYRGDVIDAHAPEMPTRFLKQLVQLVRGGLSLGMHRLAALALALRCARDSVPPLRLAILEDIAAQPDSPLRDVRRRLDKPRATVDRQLQALHVLGLLTCREGDGHGPGTAWHYQLAEGIDPAVLSPPRFTRFVNERGEGEKERVGIGDAVQERTPRDPTHISGKLSGYEADERQALAGGA